MPPMHEHSYFTYIMASRSHTLYIGVTSDLHKRVFQHKWKEHDGFTAKYNCDRLVWFEGHQEIARAITREKVLKGWRRAKKIALIEATNPVWADLSRDWYDCEPADYRRALDRMDSSEITADPSLRSATVCFVKQGGRGYGKDGAGRLGKRRERVSRFPTTPAAAAG